MADGGERLRSFFALRPPEPVRAELGVLARRQARYGGGRPVPCENIHLTLVFLGGLRPAQVEAARRVAAGVLGQAFTLELDRLGLWRRKGILWAGCRETPAALTDLVGQLQEGLRRLGFRVETRAFEAHLTLVRGAHRVGRWEGPPLSWRVEDFRLYRSRLGAQGSRYTELDRWALAPAR